MVFGFFFFIFCSAGRLGCHEIWKSVRGYVTRECLFSSGGWKWENGKDCGGLFVLHALLHVAQTHPLFTYLTQFSHFIIQVGQVFPKVARRVSERWRYACVALPWGPITVRSSRPPWCLMFPVLFATCNWLFRATCGFSSAAFLCSSNVSGKRCLGSSSEATTLKSTQQIIASESFALPSRNYSSFASPGRSRIRRGGPLMAQLMMRLMGVASLPFERFCGKNLCVCLRFEESLHGGKHFQG